jgi:hypothetical protein
VVVDVFAVVAGVIFAGHVHLDDQAYVHCASL